METKSYFYVPFSKKSDFNDAVGHCQAVISVLGADDKENIADVINEMVVNKEIVADEVLPIVSVVLLDKKNYTTSSINLEGTCKEPATLIQEIATWHGIDVVLGYQHPDLGFLLLNPKNPANASIIEGFRKNELLHVYVGGNDKLDKKLAHSVIDAIMKLLYEGKKTNLPNQVKSGSYVFKEKVVAKPKEKKQTTQRTKQAPAKRVPTRKLPQTKTSYETQPAQSSGGYEIPEHLRRDTPVSATPVGRKNMSPLVSVLVTNELFHNGNVEAWKRIIRAYNAKYPSADVMVYYDGERIVDINTLFKWGKVKHGTMIQFSVADDQINDLSKLRKYLSQGASPAFGAFLKGSPDTVLNLF